MTDIVVIPAIPNTVVTVAGVVTDVVNVAPPAPVITTAPVDVAGVATTPVIVSGNTVGPQGPPGGSYTHIQNTASSVWTINHILGFQPNAVALDSAGDVIEGVPAWPSGDSMTLTFTAAIAGTAYLS